MEQAVVFAVILAILYLFIDGRIRYEFVSALGLLILTVTGIIDPEEAFSGFGHAAVITVASVLVISEALIGPGLADDFVLWLGRHTKTLAAKIAALMGVTAFLSAFMNNIGALALMLPIAMRIAKDQKEPPSKFLMPISFASLLGGMVTLIGTPPNLIVSDYRAQVTGTPFNFFEFAPLGLSLVFLGIGFTIFLGVRLIPLRKTRNGDNLFNIGEYLAEVVVTETSKMQNKRVRDLYGLFNLEVQVLGINRLGAGVIIPKADERLLPGDILVIKTGSAELTDVVNRTGMAVRGAKPEKLEEITSIKSDDFSLVEVVLREDSLLIGRTAVEIQLRNRYNVSLIAVSRKGQLSITRLKTLRFMPGDILLLQAPSSLLQDTCHKLSCLPLSQRKAAVAVETNRLKKYAPFGLFFFGILLTTTGILPVQLAFFGVAVSLVMFKMITPRQFYEAIEWPAIILLATLIPLGGAVQKSGASDTIAFFLGKMSDHISPVGMIGVLMAITLAITNMISGTGTAVLMGPIALSLAKSMGVSPDPFLMGVCIASSSAFLTPIAHQSNMLVMGPGGYRFTDYWRLGLPLSILAVLTSVLLITKIWPF